MKKYLPLLFGLLILIFPSWSTILNAAQKTSAVNSIVPLLLLTDAGLPGSFSKSSPSNGATNLPTSLTLSWEASSGAASYEYCYDTTNDNGCSLWVSAGTMTSANLSGLSNNTSYYWQVRAKNTDGITYSNFGTFWSFTTRQLPPGSFSKSSPSNGATNLPTSLTLSWEASSGAAFYEYCYDTTNDNGCSLWVSAGTMTSANLSGLSNNTSYYWQVRAKNTGGTIYSNFGTFWSFTTGQ